MLQGFSHTIFFMKALSNELVDFMMQIVDSRFTFNIINGHKRPPKHLHDVDRMLDIDRFSAIHIHNEKYKCRPIGNKDNKHQPIEDKRKKHCFDCEMLNFALTIRILNGSGKFKIDLVLST